MEEDPNEENQGEWFHFRFREGRTRAAVMISRRALTDRFGKHVEGATLLSIYVAHSEAIHQQVRVKLQAEGAYTLERPVHLRSSDFS